MKNSLVLRKVAKHLSYRKRYLSLSSIEQVQLRRLKRLILTVMCKIKTSELQHASEDQYMTFGDSAYKRRSHLTSYYADIDELIRRWNRRMKRVRIFIEWNYGTTASLFKYICCKRKLKVLQSTNVSKIYTVCTLLRNIHIALYGCQTSNYFDLDIPDNFLEKYLMQEDF